MIGIRENSWGNTADIAPLVFLSAHSALTASLPQTCSFQHLTAIFAGYSLQLTSKGTWEEAKGKTEKRLLITLMYGHVILRGYGHGYFMEWNGTLGKHRTAMQVLPVVPDLHKLYITG